MNAAIGKAIRLGLTGLGLSGLGLTAWVAFGGGFVLAQDADSVLAEAPPMPRPEVGELSDAEALREGNRLFGLGELEAALAAYQAGYRPQAPHPTLVYNLATTFHHLNRLPEAILWYRRGTIEDPWLQENLWLARRSLGSQRLFPGSSAAAFMAQHPDLLFTAAIFFAWLSLLAALWPRLPRSAFQAALCLALVLWLSAWLMGRYGPAEAVLLADCASASGELPAGTELWLWPAGGESLVVAGFSDTRCPLDAISWIEPTSL